MGLGVDSPVLVLKLTAKGLRKFTPWDGDAINNELLFPTSNCLLSFDCFPDVRTFSCRICE